ncbi:MAG: hypothetical protein JXA25_00970 [Anaerolineales bacterium]|nr:hypothetical protein [Anaerolineales bacterium]
MLSNETIGLKGLTSNFFRQTAIQLASPSRKLNNFLEHSVEAILASLGIDPNAPSFSYQNVQFGVDWLFPGSSSAPLHSGIVFLIVPFVLFVKPYRNRDAGMLILLISLGYLLFCGYIRWQSTMRFSFATYLLLAPVVGWVMGQGVAARMSPIAAGLMILYAAPSLLFLRWRPLISWRPRTAINSIFEVSRQDLYFRASDKVRSQYEWAADRILQTGCQQVAMRTDSHDHEYYWWILLDPLENDIRIEHTLVFPGLEDLVKDDFQACALICTVCSDSPKERDGLRPVNLEDDIKLYLPEAYLEP